MKKNKNSNMARYGNINRLGKHHTEETKKRISESTKGSRNHFYGKKHTEETKKRIGEVSMKVNYGRHHSEETKNKHKGGNNHNWKGGNAKIICSICGKEKEYPQQAIKKGHGKFCSLKCKGVWQAKNNTDKNNSNWKGGKIKKPCLVCGKKRDVIPIHIKRNVNIFCSCRCSTIFKNIHNKKKNTLIERLMEDELIRKNIPYTKQVPLLGITIVDFLLPNDTIIYCDGDYWHSRLEVKKRDAQQDFMLKFYGYKVFRFWEKDINKSAKKCIDKVIKHETH